MEYTDLIMQMSGFYEDSVTVGCDQCGHMMDTTKYFIIGIIFYYILLSFLITFGFYLVYSCRKDKHPWRYALKRSWPWRIALLLIFALIYWLCLRFLFS